MKSVITGGAGFIGSHLAEELIERGHHVVVLDNLDGGNLDNLRLIDRHQRFHFVKADICESSQIAPFIEGADFVFHLAGVADIVPSVEQPQQYFKVNVQGTLNVLECARASGVKRLIYAASSSSYGIARQLPTPESAPIEPQYPYALTKYMGEELVMHWAQLYKFPALSLRLFNVYGPRSRTTGAYGAVFGVFLAQKLAGRPYTVVGDGTQTRDFTYVSDVVDAFIKAAESSIVAEVMNVGSGDHYSVNYLVQLLGGDVVHIPRRPGEPVCTFADTSKIRSMLGWQPKVTFEEGVKRMLQHIEFWKNAPVWDQVGIEKATTSWFKYLT